MTKRELGKAATGYSGRAQRATEPVHFCYRPSTFAASAVTLDGMAFRVLIAGGRYFTDYPPLRTTLDALLVNRLPDVVILTAGGPGVAAPAASYASSRGLELVAITPTSRSTPMTRWSARLLSLSNWPMPR